MFKITMFRPVQFGQTPPIAHNVPQPIIQEEKPSALLQQLEADLFVRRFPVQTPVQKPMGEDSLTRLELEFGDLKPATLMVMDELKGMLARLNFQENRQATLSTMTVNGQDHILIEAAHDGIYDRVLKQLQEMGAHRSFLDRNQENAPLKYADVPILLYERGLEEEQLPSPIREIKKMRESLGRGSTPQAAAMVLTSRLQEKGLNDLQVHPLELQQPAQLWVLYPIEEKRTRNAVREEQIRNTISNLDESEPLDGKLGFRHGNQVYPVAIASRFEPALKAARATIQPTTNNSVLIFKDWWNSLVRFLTNLTARSTEKAGLQ